MARAKRLVGEVLREIRERQKLSLGSMERLTGFPKTRIHQIESGRIKDPAFSAIMVFAESLGVSLDDIGARMRGGSSQDIDLAADSRSILEAAEALEDALRKARLSQTAISRALEALPKPKKTKRAAR